MTPSQAIPTARQRKRRTRTLNVSHRPPLAVSSLLPNNVDLLPGTEHLRCPDCTTWCPLTTDKGSQDWKQAPHHTERAGTPGARRCSGSNRRVLLDLTIAQWQERLADAAQETASRRSTTVLKKVKAPIAPAITQLDPAPATADTARRTYEMHRSRCAACTGRAHCQDGGRLANAYLRLLKAEPQHRRNRALYEELTAAAEQVRARQLPRQRRAQWAKAEPAVAAMDRARRESLADAIAPIRAAGIPTESRHTQAQSQELAQTRSDAAIRKASPLRAKTN
ncbi:hypothetical protein [Streptomyces sp. TLI_171]|uniref:hypothetical protein n=1 Tax=Streptomyces sp. TLI_171 TaxID=1938859 RepID=UPI000C183094|nr:hypothetical protein [Streptomyces sp. TLI_171]RKE02950.1 hypothetical protein BX266_7553 [Streptomyces sp. TLI_171]